MMKMALIGLVAGATVFAAPSPRVSKGQCKFESTGQTLSLTNIDPAKHYGMFATANATGRGLRVYLTINHQNAVDINVQSQGGRASYVVIPRGEGGVTQINAGLTVEPLKPGPSEWFSCKLEVTE